MQRIINLIKIPAVVFVILLGLYSVSKADAFKWVDVGKYIMPVFDSMQAGESAPVRQVAMTHYDNFSSRVIFSNGWHVVARDFTDAAGNFHPYYGSGAAPVTVDEQNHVMPLELEGVGSTVQRVMRYTPPYVEVDEVPTSDPWPQVGDTVAPDLIPGNATIMVYSESNTSLGLTITQRALGYDHTELDEAVIHDYTFTNTGNTNRDDTIELNAALTDVYFHQVNRLWGCCNHDRWNSAYGLHEGDSLRMVYNYPGRSKSADNRDFGDVKTNGYIDDPTVVGEATLYAPVSVANTADDPAQPLHVGWGNSELIVFRNDASQLSPVQRQTLYETASQGVHTYHGDQEFDEPNALGQPVYTQTAGGEPVAHGVPPDHRGLKFIRDIPWFALDVSDHHSVGPYTLQPGESFRTVRASGQGVLDVETAWNLGNAFINGTADEEFGVLDNLPPQYDQYPELAPDANTRAKDSWIYTGVDSLHKNMAWAQWAVQNDYNVPVPPPAPNLYITSQPDQILIEWDTNNAGELASEIDGFVVYRAEGSNGPNIQNDQLLGVWKQIYITDNPNTTSYADTTADRGPAYYYYVASYKSPSNSTNGPGFDGVTERLESGAYMNRTNRAANLLREPIVDDLEKIRVVPNPFYVNAEALQYPGEENKILFLELPPVCTISIYSESGDLVRKIEHINGSGDEAWGDVWQEHSATQTGQIIVSGIYIAHIETPDGRSINRKFVVVR